MNPDFYPFEVPDYRLRRHHTDELVEISTYAADHSDGDSKKAIVYARYLANQLGSA